MRHDLSTIVSCQTFLLRSESEHTCTIENVHNHCHIRQIVIESVLNRVVKISEMSVNGTEFQPKQ